MATLDKQLQYCKRCTKQSFDAERGLLCGLTAEKPQFEDECSDFELDENAKTVHVPEDAEAIEPRVVPEEIIANMRSHQELSFAIVGGFLLTIISAVIWASITVATNYQIGYMAIAVGFIVGWGVRFFGAGVDQVFGFIGAAFALLGCLLGNLFSQVVFIAQAESLTYFEVLSYLNLDLIIQIYAETFSIIDLLFYGLATYEGYKFAFRPIPADFETRTDFAPANANLRLPLSIVSFLVIGIIGFMISRGDDGLKKFYYESGQLMSTGEMKDGLEEGTWKYYYENGMLQLEGTYSSGKEDGLWEWFDIEGSITKTGSFKNGLTHGEWKYYDNQGNVSEQNFYELGRLEGASTSFYANGNINQQINYSRNKENGDYAIYYEDGSIYIKGKYTKGEMAGLWTYFNPDGSKSQEIEYVNSSEALILNVWDSNSDAKVKDGNGWFKELDSFGNIVSEGQVKDKKRVGRWKTYYSSGEIKEEGEYDGDQYKIINTWSPDGKARVVKGEGLYENILEYTDKVIEKGAVENGLKTGLWHTYYPGTDSVQSEITYEKGIINGNFTTYYPGGTIWSEGKMEMNKKVGTFNWYYENSILENTVNYVDDKKEGEQLFWNERGIETKKEVYKNGELIEEHLL